jgi:Ca-activated chloride channel homolog
MIMTDNTLDLQAGFDRSYVRTHHPSVRYLVVQTKAPKVAQENGPLAPLNLGLVMDASGSMSATEAVGAEVLSRLEAAQRASEGVVKQLDEQDRLSLVSFASESIVHLRSIPLDRQHKVEALAAIAEISTRGCTNLSDGWMAGAEQVALYQKEDPRCRHRLLLLSDGMANEGIIDPDELAETAAGLRRRGISSSAVGIGADYSTDQIESIAEHGGGMLHHTAQPGEIVEVVLAELQDMRQTVIDDLEIAVRCPQGGSERIRIEAVGMAGEDTEDGVRVALGSLVSEAQRSAVFRVFVPTGVEESLDFVVEATWRQAEERNSREIAIGLVPAQDGVVFKERSAQDIALEAAQAWQSAVVSRAMGLNREGDYEEARRYMRQQIGYFRRYIEPVKGGQTLLASMEKVLERITRPMREDARKEIGTRMYQQQRGTVDRRPSAPMAWEEYLEE